MSDSRTVAGESELNTNWRSASSPSLSVCASGPPAAKKALSVDAAIFCTRCRAASIVMGVSSDAVARCVFTGNKSPKPRDAKIKTRSKVAGKWSVRRLKTVFVKSHKED